jgi:hypothetical protein
VRRIALGGRRTISASVTITPTQAGLTVTYPISDGLDYWWAVRDSAGALTRVAGTLQLPHQLAALAQTAPITAPATLTWVERATAHFHLYAPPDSAAERDIDRLTEVAEAAYRQAAGVIAPTRPISISVYLLPRVFWQGGVAYGDGGPLAIAYLDRNYASVEAWSYFVHEVTHALGGDVVQHGGEVGGLLGEGVAVYASGGHYGQEPIDAWAAVLAGSDRYVPLCQLRYDFYKGQHEVAYQEGASFVGYLIRTYGLETFRKIYRAQHPQRGNPNLSVELFCSADNRRTVAPTGKTNATIEQEWLAYLKTIHPNEEQRRAWELTVRFFDTMRRYQETLDPPARVLPPRPTDWDQATAANFLNSATGRRAEVLETMLGAAGSAVRQGDTDRAAALLDGVEDSLAAGGAPVGQVAQDYDAIAELLASQARVLRLGDRAALDRTLIGSALAAKLPFTTGDLLHDLRYTMVALDVRGDSAKGTLSVDGASLDGQQIERALYQARFVRRNGAWLMAEWAKAEPIIELPPDSLAVNATP